MTAKAMSLKSKINAYAKQNGIAAQVVLQNYMFERFLVRVQVPLSAPIKALRNQGFFCSGNLSKILVSFFSESSGTPLGHRRISVLFLPMNKNDYQ